jgi:hypothetical protein
LVGQPVAPLNFVANRIKQPHEPPEWKIAGVFEPQDEARTAAADAGLRYGVRWSSCEQGDKDFMSGNLL